MPEILRVLGPGVEGAVSSWKNLVQTPISPSL